MGQKARLLHYPRALERIPCSSDPQSHKRNSRRVRSFDHAIWERLRENSDHAGTFTNFFQNPALKRRLWDTGNTILAEASP